MVLVIVFGIVIAALAAIWWLDRKPYFNDEDIRRDIERNEKSARQEVERSKKYL